MEVVCPHQFLEGLRVIKEKCIIYSMRIASIGIAIVIFLLSAQSKLPMPIYKRITEEQLHGYNADSWDLFVKKHIKEMRKNQTLPSIWHI